ncbi:PQQ-dependent dehydrogenase, methanol/ethanol family [Aegicerativicinus sediminis]|uniref:PQQ-dependent dehydrogenase, methanol/ethanol family n=1 Tax=Aegicerativicinus sediminis TaxID=2893202 RepID=UPI001E59BBE9|nr:PQQ-dependent dehydrogenase, methanol/ethanol family [Aegicerativicinus sediminis]
MAHIRIGLLLSFVLCSSCIKDSQNNDGDWAFHGLNYEETRFSPLSQITKNNIGQLGLDWSIDLGVKRGIEATPIVKDGVMYLTGPWSVVYAIDLKSHELIWTFDPEVPKSFGEKGCCDVVNRGVALDKDKVFLGAFDGRLIALDAESGEKIWETLTVDQSKPYTITGAPRVINDKVIIGNGGAEFGVRGYFSAYDTETGKQLWRFYTVPGDPSIPFENDAMKHAASTWTGEWWTFGGGGTVWDAMAYDTELNTLYVGTGNGSPWDRNKRSPGGGDNLYLSSILAINPDTGELLWHYQTTPGDSWDFTATQHIILADLEIDGKPRKVLMQAPKNGFYYVIDRTNGELISAEKIAYVNWAEGVDLETGKPIETKFARYDKANIDIAPNFNGAHNWQPMAFNPNLNLTFIPARETFSNYGQDSTWVYNEEGFGTGNGWNLAIGTLPSNPTITDEKANYYGKLVAWDPINQKEVWSVKQDNIWNGGVLATASNLVFQGTADGRLTAYDATNGELIWEADLHTGIMAPPVTYSVDGIQYLTAVTGWGGGYGMKNKHTDVLLPGTIYTFKIGGTQPLPSKPEVLAKKLVSTATPLDENMVKKGESIFNRFCGTCHVVAETGGGVAPDLGYSAVVGTQAFHEIVQNGIFLPLGMPNFGDRLTEEDINAIEQFIFNKADKSKIE